MVNSCAIAQDILEKVKAGSADDSIWGLHESFMKLLDEWKFDIGLGFSDEKRSLEKKPWGDCTNTIEGTCSQILFNLLPEETRKLFTKDIDFTYMKPDSIVAIEEYIMNPNQNPEIHEAILKEFFAWGIGIRKISVITPEYLAHPNMDVDRVKACRSITLQKLAAIVYNQHTEKNESKCLIHESMNSSKIRRVWGLDFWILRKMPGEKLAILSTSETKEAVEKLSAEELATLSVDEIKQRLRREISKDVDE